MLMLCKLVTLATVSMEPRKKLSLDTTPISAYNGIQPLKNQKIRES